MEMQRDVTGLVRLKLYKQHHRRRRKKWSRTGFEN